MMAGPRLPGRCVVEGHCVTCADEGVPMRVLEVAADGLTTCEDEAGRAVEVMIELVAPVTEGETLLVHAGTALARVEEAPPAQRRETGEA